MIAHMDIWTAIDRLAAAHGFSASGLAKRAGLDPTSFNPSKRTAPGGKLRWPTTESVSKILTATNTTFSNFVALVEQGDTAPTSHAELAKMNAKNVRRTVPLLGFATAKDSNHFDETGFPAGRGWGQLNVPTLQDPNAYALEISDPGLEPVYRPGDVLVISPKEEIKRGDRVVIKTVGGEFMVKEVIRKTATRLELRSPNLAVTSDDHNLMVKDIAWIAKVVWVSQ